MNAAYDQNGRQYQVTELGAAHHATIGAQSARTSRPFARKNQLVYLIPTVDCYIKFGNDAVEATTNDHFRPAGSEIALNTGAATHLAVIGTGNNGVLHVSEAG